MGTWILLGIAALIICSCVSTASLWDESEKEAKALKAQEALGPDVLKQLLAEEFPHFASDFTYARCEEVIRWLGPALKQGFVPGAAAKHLTSNQEIKDEHSANQLGVMLCGRFSSIFSADFVNWGRQNPAGFARLFMRAYFAADRRTKA